MHARHEGWKLRRGHRGPMLFRPGLSQRAPNIGCWIAPALSLGNAVHEDLATVVLDPLCHLYDTTDFNLANYFQQPWRLDAVNVVLPNMREDVVLKAAQDQSSVSRRPGGFRTSMPVSGDGLE